MNRLTAFRLGLFYAELAQERFEAYCGLEAIELWRGRKAAAIRRERKRELRRLDRRLDAIKRQVGDKSLGLAIVPRTEVVAVRTGKAAK